MNASPTHSGSTIHTVNERGNARIHRKPHVFLSLGLLCYSIAIVLFPLQNKITTSDLYKKISLLPSLLDDYLWSAPSATVVIIIFLFTSCFYYYLKMKKKHRRYLQWFVYIPSVTRFFLLTLLFLYSLFPLSWTRHHLARSLESFPESTAFDSLLLLLSVIGTILCCIYCFEKLPLRIVVLIEKVVSTCFKWKESYFISSLVIITFLVTGIIAYVVLDHIPHVQDSIAQLFQAKLFKMGMLYAPLPPHKEFFDYTNIINDGKWYSQYPPGHSFLLMLGLFLGVPWLIGPLLGTLSLYTFFLLLKTLYHDRQMRYLSCGLMLLSPFFLFMSSNYMNHSSTMFFIVLFLYGYLHMCTSPSRLWALLAGLSLGYALTIRPLDACAISIPFIYYMLISSYKKRTPDIKKVLLFFGAFYLLLCVLLIYNTLTNGHPLLFGYTKKYASLGFLGTAQGGPPHTVKGGIVNTSNNLIGLNYSLFEWPVPSLIFIFMLFVIPVRRNRWDYLFISAFISLMVSYFFYYYQDLCFGPRFYYSSLPFLIILTVRGFLALPEWLQNKGFDRRRTEASLYLLLLLCFLYMLSFSLPSLIKKYSNDYWWVTAKIHNAVKEQGIHNAIVFIDVWHPPSITEPNLIPYGSGFQFNSPDLRDDVIYAIDLKWKNEKLMKAFPGRDYYLCKIHKPMSDFTLLKLNE